jgi:cytochrome c
MRAYVLWLLLGAILILGAPGYFHMRDPEQKTGGPVWTVPGGDPSRGRRAILKYGCSACHVIPGVREATGRVGPKLEDIHRQIYIGGVLPNFPDNLIRWIQDPQEFSPETAMPNLDVSEQDARDITAHLHGRS